jgi:Protein of unknown function (DUF3307)
VTWAALFGVFLLCHLAGDFLLQTDWQATHKQRGLGRDPDARRALGGHAITYTLAFVPALLWVAGSSSAAATIGFGLLIGLPHVAVDDGRLVEVWVAHVKRVREKPSTVVQLGVDQTLHVLALGALALLVTG